MVNVAVIGAGIVGYSSAVNVQRLMPNAKVTILADQFGDELVSYGAGGLFRPELSKVVGGNKNKELIKQCIRDSWAHYTSLALSEDAKEGGHMMVFGLMSHRRPMEEDYCMMRELTYDFRPLSDIEIQKRGISKEFKYNYSCTTVVTHVTIYMDWLKKQFEANGGKLQKRTVNKLEELYGEYQMVINCCGDRARTLVGDKECYPSRGQLVRVKAPWFNQYHFFDSEVLLIPHMDKLNIGGIRILGDDRKEIMPEVSDTILRNAQAMYPQLKGVERVGEWAHTRPGRCEPRIEKEILNLGGKRRLTVIHNYGHEGNGVTLSWGSAKHAAELAKKSMLEQMVPKAAL